MLRAVNHDSARAIHAAREVCTELFPGQETERRGVVDNYEQHIKVKYVTVSWEKLSEGEYKRLSSTLARELPENIQAKLRDLKPEQLPVVYYHLFPRLPRPENYEEVSPFHDFQVDLPKDFLRTFITVTRLENMRSSWWRRLFSAEARKNHRIVLQWKRDQEEVLRNVVAKMKDFEASSLKDFEVAMGIVYSRNIQFLDQDYLHLDARRDHKHWIEASDEYERITKKIKPRAFEIYNTSKNLLTSLSVELCNNGSSRLRRCWLGVSGFDRGRATPHAVRQDEKRKDSSELYNDIMIDENKCTTISWSGSFLFFDRYEAKVQKAEWDRSK